MHRIKVGIVVENNNNPHLGGGHFYQQRLTQLIDRYDFDSKIEIIFVSEEDNTKGKFRKKVIFFSTKSVNNSTKILALRFVRIFFSNLLLNLSGIREKINNKIQHQKNIEFEKFLENEKVHLLYYLAPKEISINYPYIMTHWDLGHKSMYAFPEVTLNFRYEVRERYHKGTLAKAFAIFAESHAGKKELVNYERINPNRVFVVPLVASSVVDTTLSKEAQLSILKRWELSEKRYYFYPAQFWSHKNHYSLIMAFKKVAAFESDVKLVLSGSDKGNLDYVLETIERNNLTSQIVVTGFVDNKEIYTFYKNAISLIMPSFLGPTNMPLLEAQQLGCPVLCSDLEGHREQLGALGQYFDPTNINEIADLMINQIDAETASVKIDKSIDSNVTQIINNHLLKIARTRMVYGFNYSQG